MKKRQDGRYVETITVGSKRRYFYGTSPAEVKRKMREYEEQSANGRALDIIAAEWDKKHNETIKYNTQKYYKTITRNVIEHFAGIPIRRITPAEIRYFLDKLVEDGYGKKVVTAHKNVLNMIYKYAASQTPPDVLINIVSDISLPKNMTSKKRELPPDDYIKIVDEGNGVGDGLLPFLLLWSGCRRCEALALTWADIDFTHKTINVDKIVEFHSNTPQIRVGTKTDAGTRQIYMTDRLADALKAVAGRKDEYVFGGESPWTNTKFRRTWERYCKTNNMMMLSETRKRDWKGHAVLDESGKPIIVPADKPALTPHQLRHAYVTMLFEAGVDEKTAMSQTGHADEKTIREIYTHLREKKAAEAVIKINNFKW